MPTLPHPAAELRQALLQWYQLNKRDLPWRSRPDPYAIWISEIMLQQTQVEVVRRYYQRFLDRFPDVVALANARDEDVMAAWSGLGYYRRARLMHRAAQVMRDEHGGQFPSSPEAIRALPGVGAYTSGALLSIAFNTPAPAVDGNVMRVLMRVLGMETGPQEAQSVSAVTHAATELSVGPRPGDLTQGLMELGATVCTKANPRCSDCPWSGQCRARAMNAVDRIPPARKRVARKPLNVALALLRDGERLCLIKRPSEGLFGGLWELPSSGEVALPRRGALLPAHLQSALTDAHPGLRVGRLLSRTERTLTHKDLVLWTFAATAAQEDPGWTDARWCTPGQLEDAPLSTAMRAALKDALGAWDALA